MFLKLLGCMISLAVCVDGYIGTSTSVDTPAGQILGPSRDNYTAFLGVPYGLVDETNPFGNARPHPYFNIPREAFDDSSICPQYDRWTGQAKGTIQCLHLNVYTPKPMHTWSALPVMVFIHGGAFVEGDGALGTYSPRYLLRHGVIVVTINYRLGPYGNLCVPHTEYSNQALKDQSLAFRWVKRNIGSFGGDTDNILLMGHSAGSMSAHFHLLFNRDILYNKVILQSGVAVSPLCNQATVIATFVKDVGQDAENIDIDRFIQTISAIDTNSIINITKFYDFQVCIDGEFISKSPKQRNLQNIKLMIGGTMKEMLFYYPRADNDNSGFVTELNRGFSVTKMADSTNAIDAIKYFYLNHSTLNMVDYASDIAFNYPTERTVRYYVQNKCTVYRYLFSYDGGRNFVKVRDNITAAGATHGDELGYLFDMPLLKTTPADQVIIDRMSLLWTNFAKYGEPTPTTSDLLPVKWTPVTAGANTYLRIDTNLRLDNGLFKKRMDFWDGYYARYGMFAKGITLGDKYTNNRAFNVDLTQLLLFISCLLLWQ